MLKDYSSVYAATDDKFEKSEFDKKVDKKNQVTTKGIEVGHIFYFGDKYSKPLNCFVDNQKGKNSFQNSTKSSRSWSAWNFGIYD